MSRRVRRAPWRHTVNAENPIPADQRFTFVEVTSWDYDGVGGTDVIVNPDGRFGGPVPRDLAERAAAEDPDCKFACELIEVGEADRLRAIEDAARYLLEVNGPDDWLAWSYAWTSLEAACAVEQQETLKALGAPDEENP